MEFIEKEDLLREVYNEDLASLKRSNLIDDSILYPTIDECIAILKVKTKVVKAHVIKIDNFKGELPEDFFKLISAVTCDRYEYTYTNPSIQIDYEPVVCHQRPCEEPMISCNGDKYYLNQRFENYTIHFDTVRPLGVKKVNKNICSDMFKNWGKECITIENGYINSEFRCGYIYISYESIENDGMIPNVVEVKKAIKTLVSYKGLYNAWVNGEADLIQKVQYLERRAAIAEDTLKLWAKRLNHTQINNLRHYMISRYNVFTKMVNYR